MKIRTLATMVALALALPAFAQEAKPQEAPKMSPEEAAMMQAYQQAGTPGAQHAEMAKAAGDYTLSIKSWHSPGADAMESTGTAKRSMVLGGRVMTEDVQSEMMGMPFTGHGMTGYDNASGKWWSTWNDSMSTGLMVSEGDCDAKGACTFNGSWTDPMTKKEVKARMTTKWTSPDVEVFEMYSPGPDGKEMKMMEITYTRKK